MRYTLKGICGTAVALAVLLGAMNVTNIDERAGKHSGSHIPYNRLLSGEYHKVATFLENKDLHDEAYFFYNKSASAKDVYNLRPMTVSHISTLHKSELRKMRRDLERAMVGYEMRHAPQYVAAMHAAFECSVKTASLHHEIVKFCTRNFNNFKVTAEKSLQNSKMMIAKVEEKAPNIIAMAPIYEKSEEKPVEEVVHIQPVAPIATVALKKDLVDEKSTVPVVASSEVTDISEEDNIISKEALESSIDETIIAALVMEMPKEKMTEPPKFRPIPPLAPIAEKREEQNIVQEKDISKPLVSEVEEKKDVIKETVAVASSDLIPSEITDVEAVKEVLYEEAEVVSLEQKSLLDTIIEYLPFTEIREEKQDKITAEVKTEEKPEGTVTAEVATEESANETKKVAPSETAVTAQIAKDEGNKDIVLENKSAPIEAQFSLLTESEDEIKSEILLPLGPYGKPISLADIVAMSLTNNPDRMIATAQYYGSKAGVEGARSGYYPQIDAVLTMGRESNNPFSDVEERFDHAGYNGANTANIRFKQLIFDGFVTSETVSERLQVAKASRLNHKKVSEEIAFSAVQIYMQLKQFQEMVLAAEENYDALLDVQDLVNLRIAAGDRNHTEKKYIEARVASAEQRLIDARAGLSNAQSALEFMLGRSIDFTASMPIIKEDKRFTALEAVVLDAFKTNTEANILRAQEDRSSHMIEAAIGKFYPQLALVMEAGHIEDVGGDTGIVRNAVAKLELTLPIFDGWLRSATVDQRKAELQEAKANSMRYRRQLKQDLKTAYNNRVGAMQEVKTAIQEIESNKELDILNRQRFKYGEGDIFITDLVETRERIFNSKVNKAQFETDIVTSHYRIQQILGEILPEFCDISCEVD